MQLDDRRCSWETCGGWCGQGEEAQTWHRCVQGFTGIDKGAGRHEGTTEGVQALHWHAQGKTRVCRHAQGQTRADGGMQVCARADEGVRVCTKADEGVGKSV